jgi:4'-phosphopantetheinyl transferase
MPTDTGPRVIDTPPLRPGDCHVWWTTPDQRWPGDLIAPQERQRHDELRRPEDRQRFLAGAALSRLLLGAHCGTLPEDLTIDRTCVRCGQPHGKPRLLDPASDLEYSVSHAGERIAVAIARGGPVGVDVESLQRIPDVETLAPHVLSAPERAAEKHQDVDDFLRYWARKEAVLKATGDGLRAPMAELTISAPDEPARVVSWASRPDLVSRIVLADLHPGDGYVACVAHFGEGDVSEFHYG